MFSVRRLATLLSCALFFGCSSNTIIDGQARFQILTPSLIRLEFADDRHFEDGITFNRVKSRFAPVRYKTRVVGDWREIETDEVVLRYLRGSGPFNRENTTLYFIRDKGALRTPFGAPPTRPLGGWVRALDGQGDPVALHDGLLNRDGWYVLDDSKTAVTGDDGWIAPRDAHVGAYVDQYLFAYGHAYARGLADFIKLSGPPPMLPRWAFGIWYSRYFPYFDSDYRQKLLPRFRSEHVPLDVLVVDTDWKRPIAGQTPAPRWNSWAWNTELFPDGNAFLHWAGGEGLHVTLNVHPSITSGDPMFAAANADAGGLTKIEEGKFVWDWGNRKQAASYFALHDPFESAGVRFWWLDWCCEEGVTNVPGTRAGADLVPPDAWIDSLYAARATAHGLRGFAFGRIGARCRGPGSIDSTTPTGPWPDHRYTIHFTGDTFPTWGMLRYQIGFTVAEGSTGFPYVTHDLGSFFGRQLPDDVFVRWVQFGAFQPIFRLHSDHGDRLPWDYGDTVRGITEKFMQLRESLIPYLYTLGREAFDTGLPLARGLYLDFPNEENAYKYKDEYLLGDALLVVPITEADNLVTAWFPPGAWINIFTGERVSGPPEQIVKAALDTMPVYARAGAIVPRQPPMSYAGERPLDPLLLDVYPGADGAFSLYEDEGEGLKYLDGKFRRTPIRYVEAQRTLIIEPAAGRYEGALSQRAYQVELVGLDAPSRVTVDGEALPASAWRYDEKRHSVTVQVPAHDVSRKLTLTLS